MERAQIMQVLREVLEDTRGEPYEQLDEQSNLREGLGLDSVDLVCMVMEVQNRLRVNLSVAELEPIVCVKDLLDLLAARTAAPSTKQAA
jgi:acyl carrier protein